MRTLYLLILSLPFQLFGQANEYVEFSGTSSMNLSMVTELEDGNLALGGVLADAIASGAPKRMYQITKLDSARNIAWTQTLGLPDSMSTHPMEAVALPDTGLVVLATYRPQGTSNLKGVIWRLDAGGNVVWEKEVSFSNSGPNTLVTRNIIKLTADGNLLIGINRSIPYDVTLINMDLNGNTLWEKTYSQFRMKLTGLHFSNDSTVKMAFYYSAGQSSPRDQLAIYSLRISDGSILKRTFFEILNTADDQFTGTSSIMAQDGSIYFAGNYQEEILPTTITNDVFLARVSAQDSMVWFTSFRNQSFTNLLLSLGLDQNESPFIIYSETVLGFDHVYSISLDSLGNILNTLDINIHDQVHYPINFNSQTIKTGQNVFLTNYSITGTIRAHLNFLYPFQGRCEKAVNPILQPVGNYPFGNQETLSNIISINSNLSPQFTALLSKGPGACICPPAPLNDTSYCLGDSIQIDASGGTQYIWSPAAGLSCTDCPNPWVSTDTNITYTVAVDTGSSCAFYDTILVQVLAPPVILPSLPNDTSICSSDSLVLYPGSFDSYLWQDGSSDSTFTAYGNISATYYVTVGNPDSCFVTDSIKISPATPATYNIPDTSVFCAGDSLYLDVLGANSVSWSPSNAVDCDTCSTTFSTGYTGYIYVNIDSGLSCPIQDSFYLHAFAEPNVFLGNDTSLCLDGFYFLDAGNYASYLWQDGSSGQTFPISSSSSSGIYWVEVTDTNGCTARDSIDLTIFSLPAVSLGPDRVICENETIILSYSGAGNITWSDGSGGATLACTDPGIYWLEVEENGCIKRDSIELLPNLAPKPFLGNDTSLCPGSIISLSPDSLAAFTDFNWSTGSNDTSINLMVIAGQSSLYWLETTDTNGCVNRDSILITGLNIPTVSFASDEVFYCEGDSIWLNPNLSGTPDSILWSTGESSDSILVDFPGIIYVGAFTDGCLSVDTINVIESELPYVELGEDIGICKGDSLLLTTSTNAFITWNNGVSGPNRYIFGPGLFWAGASNGCGFDRDTIIVYDLGCDCLVEMPDVFTPNNDGQNDELTPFIDCSFIDYRLEIYNRWGTQVAVLHRPNIGWDGLFNGSPAAEGTYFYVIHGRSRSQDYNRSGHFSLIR